MPNRTKGSEEARVIVPKDLIGVGAVAELLGIDVSNVRRAIYAGRLVPLAELGESSKFIFDRQDILALAPRGEP